MGHITQHLVYKWKKFTTFRHFGVSGLSVRPSGHRERVLDQSTPVKQLIGQLGRSQLLQLYECQTQHAQMHVMEYRGFFVDVFYSESQNVIKTPESPRIYLLYIFWDGAKCKLLFVESYQSFKVKQLSANLLYNGRQDILFVFCGDYTPPGGWGCRDTFTKHQPSCHLSALACIHLKSWPDLHSLFALCWNE